MRPAGTCAFHQRCAWSFFRSSQSFSSKTASARRFTALQHLCKDEAQESLSDQETIKFYEQEVVPRANGQGLDPIGAPVNVQEKIKRLKAELKDLTRNSNINLDHLSTEAREAAAQYAGITHEGLESQEYGRSGEAPVAVLDGLKDAELNSAHHNKSPEIELRLPDGQAKSLRQLNIALRQAKSSAGNTRHTRLLLQRYNASKQAVPGFLKQLPEAAWRIIWDNLYNSTILSEARSKHLWNVADDMLEAGLSLTHIQQMVRIEGRFATGQFREARDLWNESRSELSGNPGFTRAFWSVGTRIYIACGDVDHALKLAFDVAQRDPSACIATFIPLIETFLETADETSIQKAAGAYFYVRLAMGDKIKLEDFDRLSMCFLKGGQPDLAIGVFKDAVLSQGRIHSNNDSLRLISTHVLDKLFQSQSSGAELANHLSLKTLRHLPKKFENKYFYASWLKRLIGLDELKAAEQVLGLMYQRGIRADAKHINGLISAWFRRGTPAMQSQALEVGKAMLKARLELVNMRHATRDFQPQSQEATDQRLPLPPYLGRAAPPATIETFSILLLYYEISNMTQSMAELQRTLELAELAPSIFFINHCLHGHLRAGEFGAAWRLYVTTMQNGVRPDLETFNILWELCQSHVEHHAPGRGQAFPTPRALFGYMTAWLGSLSKDGVSALQAKFKPKLYNQIIRCLYLARDVNGTLVGLYALRDLLGAYPDQSSVRLVVMLIARLDERQASQRLRLYDGTTSRRRRSGKIHGQANFERAMHLLEELGGARTAELAEQGIDTACFDQQQNGEEILWLLGRFLKKYQGLSLERDAESRRVTKFIEARHSQDGGLDEAQLATERLEEVAFQMGGGGFDAVPPQHN